MSSILENIYIEYNANTNSKHELSEKIDLILSKFSIDNDLPIYYIGILYDFILKEPQYYYNQNVTNEVLVNLNNLYDKDKKIFLEAFYKYFDKFFYSLNSYHNVIDLYDEFDDIGLENVTKAKIYYIPIITQLMEYSLNHFYRAIASIEGEFKGKDYSSQKTLGKLKNILIDNYPNLLNIDINFRNALSHGTLDIQNDKINYPYQEKGSDKIIFKELKHYDLVDKKNNLIDIASGAFVGLFMFIIEKAIPNDKYFSNIDEKMSFEFFKLFLHNENIKVKSYSKDLLGSSQFNIHLDIKNINNKNQLIHILILISKAMIIFFPDYERYFINYTHPYSISGMISFEKEQLKQMLLTDEISELDKIIGNYDNILLIPDIQDSLQDYRSYKFHTFPKIIGKDWEVVDLRDISNESTKRFKAKLIIDKEKISRDEVIKLMFQVIKKIKLLENKNNPQTKIKSGKIEADLVRLEVFYRPYGRDKFTLLKNNNNFICFVHYYRKKSIPKIDVAFQDNYNFERIKKFEVFWNKNYILLLEHKS